MSHRKVIDEDYLNFLIATPKHCTATEAVRVLPEREVPVAHDAFTRLLTRLEPQSTALWEEAKTEVQLLEGLLVLDDSTLDKPYAKKMALVSRHWSGKHHAVVQGISLVTLLWTDGDRHIPCDYRVYHKPSDSLTKNDHFQAMVRAAHERGFRPKCVAFDGWYSSLENLKTLRGLDWRWLTRFKPNRLVKLNGGEARPLSRTEISASGTQLWLPGYGLILVFKVVATDGDIAYWATDDLGMTELTRLQYAEFSWQIEEYHRGLKQCTEVERCQVRSARGQLTHIGLALRAFLRLEVFSFRTGIQWVNAKTEIIREAVRKYLAHPYIVLQTA